QSTQCLRVDPPRAGLHRDSQRHGLCNRRVQGRIAGWPSTSRQTCRGFVAKRDSGIICRIRDDHPRAGCSTRHVSLHERTERLGPRSSGSARSPLHRTSVPIPQPPTPDGQKILAILEYISGQLRDLIHVPVTLEGAAKSISVTAEALASSSNQFASSVTAIDTSAESLASAGNQLVSAAATMNEIADALKTNTSNDLATVLKQLVSGLEEI